MLVLALVAEPFKSGFNHFHWPTAILTGSFFLAFVLLFLYLVKRDQKAAMPKREGCILGTREFEMTDDGFSESTAIGKSFIRWSAVEEIIEDSEGCYLFIDTILACIIPASAFSSEAEKRAFIAMVSERTGLSAKEIR